MGFTGRQVRYRLEYIVFRCVAALFRALPVETASAVSGRLWRTFAPHLKRHRRALDNLAAAFPAMSLAERETIARDMWDNLGRTFAEAFHLAEIAGGERIIVEDAEKIEGFARQHGGAIYCSGHFANWELIVAGMGRCGIRPMSIYQTVKNPLVDAYLLELRRFLYTGGLYPKNHAAAQRLVRGARAGADISLLVDLRDHGGLPIEFFGRPAPTSPFPAMLSRSQGLPVYICSFVREENVRFRLRIHRLETPRADDRQADILGITKAIHGEIEAIIRANPAQWTWSHRRWGRA